MERVLFDTDVILDFLLLRPPFAADALILFELAEKGRLEITTAALAFSNIFYIARKLLSREKALEMLQLLDELTTALPVNQTTVRLALQSGFSDFEDALQNFCAEQAGISTLVTRNVRDFAKSGLAIHTPDSYLHLLQTKGY